MQPTIIPTRGRTSRARRKLASICGALLAAVALVR